MNPVAARLFAAVVCLLSLLPGAEAADLRPLLKQLASDERSAVVEAVEALGNSGDPLALSILEALQGGTLRLTPAGRALIASDTGSPLQELGSGKAAAADPTALVTPLVSNQVRRAIEPAIAQLQLVSPDGATRLKAARELARRAGPEDAALMRAVLARETEPEIRLALESALARLDLTNPDRDLRLQAIRRIQAQGDIQLKSELVRLTAAKEDGAFAEPDAEVRAAAAAAIHAIDRRQTLVGLVANLLYGLSLGSVLLLAALGLAITFGQMGIINMAHGEMLMLGAYTAYAIQNFVRSALPGLFDYYLVPALPAAFLVCALVGIALERSILRFLYGRPLESLLATWGISLVIIQVVRLVFGAQNVTVANPSWLSGGYAAAPGLVLPYSRVAIVLLGAIVVALVWLLLQRTSLGLQIRAVTQNRPMAASMGVRTAWVDTLTFALGSGVAGIGGVALSQLGNVGPELGQSYIVDSFMVVVLGGVGNIGGAIAGAMGLGIVAKYLEPFTDAVLAKIFLLLFIILFIQKRPQGLFALKGRAAEG
jgi:urea transport system permease protein